MASLFDVRDEASVNAWKEKAQQLNDKAKLLIQESTDALNEFRQTAEGQVFEKVVEYSSQVISGMVSVMRGMNEILDAVNKLVSDVKRMIQGAISEIADTTRKVLG